MERYYWKIGPFSRVFDIEPMTYGEYVQRYGNEFDWDTSHLEHAEGYAKKSLFYGEVSWIDKEIFDDMYVRCDQMPFSMALDLMKAGYRVARKGWNDRGMFVVYQKGYPDGVPCNQQTAEAWGLQEGDLFIWNPYLQMKQADGSHSVYTPSMDDLMAEDWALLYEPQDG